MPFEIKKKEEKITSEKDTRVRILTIAQVIGCYEETKRIFEKYDQDFRRERKDAAGLQKMAIQIIIDLHKLDHRLVDWLLNDKGEIVVGDKIAIKVLDYKPSGMPRDAIKIR